MTTLGSTDFGAAVSRGKVRDTYAIGDVLLMIATDRISAYDVVLPSLIPGKGALLTQMSAFWFDLSKDIVPNHFLELVEDAEQPAGWCSDGYCPIFPPTIEGRSMIVKRARPLPIECVVRGYLAGSGWSEYANGGTLNGARLPAGLQEATQLPEPIFTPSTKADRGHDVALTRDEAIALVGADRHQWLEQTSLTLYRTAAEHAASRGILIADTKFEFGDTDDGPMLIDEALTPDSSRFWPADHYEPGRRQPSFDKQFVRDYVRSIGWSGEGPAPALPEEVIAATTERYRDAFTLITGAPAP